MARSAGLMTRRNAAFAALTVAVLAAGGGLWWYLSPSAFHGPDDPAGVTGSRTVGAETHFGMAYWRQPAQGSATLETVRPHVLSNTAGATITFTVCTPAGDVSIGSSARPLARECAETEPVEGAVLSPSGRSQLLMTVTSTRPGVVEIRGADLTYAHGRQRGTQAVGEHILMRYTDDG